MSREAILKVLGDIALADATSYWIVGALTLLVVVVMRAMLPVKSLALVFAPAIFWGGLAGIYAASRWSFVVIPEHSANIVATATLGMIAALVVMMLLARGVAAATRIRKPVARTAAAPPRQVRI